MKFCDCIFAETNGTCGAYCVYPQKGLEDPPIEATCEFWKERVDPITNEPLGPVHPPPERKEKIRWRSGSSK